MPPRSFLVQSPLERPYFLGAARAVGNEPGGSKVIVSVVGWPPHTVVTVVTSRASTARAVGNAPGGSKVIVSVVGWPPHVVVTVVTSRFSGPSKGAARPAGAASG